MNALYSLHDALVSINVPSEKARAVVDAMERDMTILLATKSDLATTRELLEHKIDARCELLGQRLDSTRAQLEHKIELLGEKMMQMRSSITIQVGSMLVVVVGLLFAALKLT